ncbi:MAG TPA: lactate utilization protein [Aggregatilineaceae bacterium]|nr:lactate utilization protein [Aggregatilineaceae bacterium]
MTTSRDKILSRLRAQSRADQSLPSVWRSRRQFDDPIARYATALKKVYGEPYHVASLDAALEKLDELLPSLAAEKVVVNDEPPFNTLNLASRWPAIDWHIVDHTTGDLRAFCAAADVGISSAEVVLAETGSLLVTSGPGQSRLATLLPPVHIALVPTDRLVTDIFAWITASSTPPPAAMTLISGPSKTGDIEQTMSIGVHGPKRFIVILYAP